MSETEATNPVAEEELDSTEATEVADEAHAQGDDHQDTDEETGEASTSEDEETEEIEREGKRYRIPKALKGELLMQADYTRKTQELAETRKAFEAEKAAETVKLTELRTEIAKVAQLEEAVQSYTNVDWQALFQQDPNAYRYHSDQHQALKDQLRAASETLSAKEQERLRDQQAKQAQAAQETVQTLSRDIPGFNQELAGKILEYGVREHGLKPEEARELMDPRVVKLLHRAMSAESKLAEAQKKQTITKRAEAVQQVKPAVSVKGAAPSTGLHDNLSPEEWTRRRNAQLAKRR